MNDSTAIRMAATTFAQSTSTTGDDAFPLRAVQPAVLSANNLAKSYRKGSHTIEVLRSVSFNIYDGEFAAIVGKSGGGKSTLMHLLAALDVPDCGELSFRGQRYDNWTSAKRDRLRNTSLAMVFQFYHLLPELTTLENVMVPQMISASWWKFFQSRRAAKERAAELLELVGLSHRLTHFPRELSGGEMQRAAIARALMANPELLLADEPTGNLDQATGEQILDVLRRLNADRGLTIVMVTHDAGLAKQCDRTLELADGCLTQGR